LPFLEGSLLSFFVSLVCPPAHLALFSRRFHGQPAPVSGLLHPCICWQQEFAAFAHGVVCIEIVDRFQAKIHVALASGLSRGMCESTQYLFGADQTLVCAPVERGQRGWPEPDIQRSRRQVPKRRHEVTLETFPEDRRLQHFLETA